MSKMHPSIKKGTPLHKMIEESDREQMRGMEDKSKPLHRFHDPAVADDPVETRNSKWASDYITDHSYMGREPLHHEIVHPDGRSEHQFHQPGEWVGKGKYAFRN